MTMHERVSGVWKEITEAHVNVSGTWKEILEGWVNVSGTWKQFFAAAAFPLDGDTISLTSETNDPGTATVGFRLKSDGNAESREQTPVSTPGYQAHAQDWIDPTGVGTGADYEVRLTAVTGSVDSGTTGSWLALSSDRTWEVADSSLTGQTFEGTLEIRRASDSVVVSTSTLSLTARTVL